MAGELRNHHGGKMAEAVIRWLEDGIFVGTDSTNHSIVISEERESGRLGMKASELLLVALAGCTAVDVVNILRKKRMPLERLEIRVRGEQESDPPWTYKKIHVTYRLKGHGLTEQAVEQAIVLSDTKYCSVAASLRNQVEIGHEFVILQEGE
jgi:putative redox protein